MYENPLDKTESKLTATEDIKWVLNKKNKLWMPERKGTHKRVNSLAMFFKTWATPLTILISVVGFLWGVYQFNAQQVANQAQALDQQRQMTFDTYLDRMSDLIFMDGLATSNPGSEVREIAAARTSTALRSLDGMRKGALIRFLWRAHLITGSQPIVQIIGVDLSETTLMKNTNLSRVNLVNDDLSGANLSYTDLYGANLSSVNFSGANLAEANLAYADLLKTDLIGANLRGANLYGAYVSGPNLPETVKGANYSSAHLYSSGLKGANLSNALLAGAYLYNTNLYGTNLSGDQLQNAYLNGDNLSYANLKGANLSGVDLSGANLRDADLRGADLSGANLSDSFLEGVNLQGANLTGATVTQAQLVHVKSLKGAIMPDGSMHP